MHKLLNINPDDDAYSSSSDKEVRMPVLREADGVADAKGRGVLLPETSTGVEHSDAESTQPSTSISPRGLFPRNGAVEADQEQQRQ